MRDPRRNPDKPFFYVDISAIDRSLKLITSAPEIIGAEAPSRARKEIRKGDVLVSTVRPNLNAVAVVPPELDGQIASTGFCVLRPNRSSLEEKYLFYFTITSDFIGILSSKVRGAHYPAVSDGDVKEIEMPLPPPSEQRRIVEILDQANALRKKRTEANAKADRILSALFCQMFGDPSTNTKGWPIEPFGKLGELDRGRSRHRPRNAPELLGGPYPFIQTGDVATSKYYINTFLSTYSEVGLAQSKMWSAGTLCITIAANIAASAILGFDACFPDSIVGFTPGHRTNSAYIQVLLGFIRPILERSAPQVAQKNINLQILRRLPIPVPPKNLQDKFLYYYEDCYSSLSSQENITSCINSLWDILLHRAFTGDLTAKWRETHMKELLAEMELQAKALKA
jgi:type I restriction enzyme S subunit